MAAALLALVALAPAIADEPAERWDQRRIRDYPIYSLLVKGGSAGASLGTEVRQWELFTERGLPFEDPRREPDLRKLLAEHGDTEYADDAALLLARARFLYHGDAAGAIEGLYAVIRNYPEAPWIAEDHVFLEHAMLSERGCDGTLQPPWFPHVPLERIAAAPSPSEREELQGLRRYAEGHLAYFEHLDRHPHYTADEARYWIAWIIMRAGLEDRYDEAERVLRQVMDERAQQRRTRVDMEAVEQAEFGYLLETMQRTERRAHALLIDLLLRRGDATGAEAAAQEYARLHEGHRTVEHVRASLEPSAATVE